MRMTWRDGLASVFVLVAVLVYGLWLADVEVFGLGARGIGVVVLGLGLASSVIAVVYGVGAGLMQANRRYLAVASLFGIIACVAGVATLLYANEPTLGVLVGSTVVLWAIATVRHAIRVEASVEGPSVPTSLKEAA
jgi:uncharacterized membrane protein YkgB